MSGDEQASLVIRLAEAADLEAIVRIFMADEAGGHGDDWSEANRPAYEQAMRAILMSPLNRLYVATLDGGAVDTGGRGMRAAAGTIVGTYQLTITPGLVGRGRTRATAESVHVLAGHRGAGIGAALMAHAIAEARAAGAATLQLTSNKARGDAHRFYERLGFKRSHEGFKLAL